MSGSLTRAIVNALDRVIAKVRPGSDPQHLKTGRRGEDEAYFHLRKLGYTVVARNWRTPRRRGEIDIVAWDEGVLAIVEVKTRSAHTMVPAELAVDREKQRELVMMARTYLRRLPAGTPYRFDVVSVYMVPGEPIEVQLLKDAFGWKTQRTSGREY